MKRKERLEQLALATVLSRIVISGSDIAEMGRAVAHELKGLMSVDWAAICLLHTAESTFHILPLSSRIDSEVDLGRRVPLEGTPPSWVALNAKALVQDDLTEDGRFWTDASWAARGLRTLAHLPLMAEGRVFGSLVFGSRNPRAYGKRELRLLRYATIQLSSPIRHAKSFSHLLEEQVRPGLTAQGRMEQVERALDGFASAMATYAEHLESHTAAILDLRSASQRLGEAADKQNSILIRLASAIEKGQLPGEAAAQEPPATRFPEGCIMNRPGDRRRPRPGRASIPVT